MSNRGEFDLDRAMDEAWELFADRLSTALASMDEQGAALRIDARESAAGESVPGLWCRRLADGRIRVEASGNARLNDEDAIPAEGLARMEEAGWEPPTLGPPPCRDFHAEAEPENTDRLADLSVVALRQVYDVPHPAFLVPDQLAEILTLREPETLSGHHPEDVVATMPRTKAHLDSMVLDELTQVLGHEPLRDSDGDWAIRVGTAMVFVRTTPDAAEVIVFAVVVHDVEGRSRAMEVLNDLNAETRFVRFELIRDRVFLQMSVLAQPFVPVHLHRAVATVTEIADGVDEALARKFGGRTTFPGQSGDGDRRE